MPLYFAAVIAARQKLRRQSKTEEVLSPEIAWTVLLSSTIGCLLPSWLFTKTGWSYAALSVWQLYLLFVDTLNSLLLPILRAILPRRNTSVTPIVISGLLDLSLSVMAHHAPLRSPLAWHTIVLYKSTGRYVLAEAAHLFFVWDYAFVAVASLSHIATFNTHKVRKAGVVAGAVAISKRSGPAVAGL